MLPHTTEHLSLHVLMQAQLISLIDTVTPLYSVTYQLTQPNTKPFQPGQGKYHVNSVSWHPYSLVTAKSRINIVPHNKHLILGAWVQITQFYLQITQFYLQTTPYLPFTFIHFHQMTATTVVAGIWLQLTIYRPQKDERLSWPGWLTNSR